MEEILQEMIEVLFLRNTTLKAKELKTSTANQTNFHKMALILDFLKHLQEILI